MSLQILVCVFGSLASEPVVRRLFTLRGSGSRLKGAYGDLVYPPNTCPHALSYFRCQKFLELSITRLQVSRDQTFNTQVCWSTFDTGPIAWGFSLVCNFPVPSFKLPLFNFSLFSHSVLHREPEWRPHSLPLILP